MKTSGFLLTLFLAFISLAIVIDIIRVAAHNHDVKTFMVADTPRITWEGEDHQHYTISGGEDMILNASCGELPQIQYLNSTEKIPARHVGDVWVILDYSFIPGTIQSAGDCTMTIDSVELVKVTSQETRSFGQMMLTAPSIFGSLVLSFLILLLAIALIGVIMI